MGLILLRAGELCAVASGWARLLWTHVPMMGTWSVMVIGGLSTISLSPLQILPDSLFTYDGSL